MLCVLFLYYSVGTFSLELTLKDIFLKNFLMANLISLDVNNLYNVHAIEGLIPLIVGPNVEIIANSHLTKDFSRDFSFVYSQAH